MTNRGSEPRVVLVIDAADASLHFVVVLLIEIFHDIKLHIPPSFRSESIDRINIADSFERFTHQHQTFFFDLDDAPSGTRVRL